MQLAPDAGESAGTPSPAPAPQAPPPIDLSTRVKLGDREVPITELVREAQEASQLRGFRDAVTGFHRAREGGDANALAQHARAMLQGMGHDQAEAERLTSEFLQQSGLSGTRGEPEGGNEEMPSWARGLADKLTEMEGRLQSADRLSQEAVARQMNEQLQSSVRSALVADEESRKMVQSLTRIRGEEGVPNLERMIREQTLRNLKDRRETSGRPLQQSWVTEEASKAAKQVLGSISAVIGDVSRLGASTETDGDRDVVIQRARSVQKPKASHTTTESDVDAWINAQLTEASLGTARPQNAI